MNQFPTTNIVTIPSRQVDVVWRDTQEAVKMISEDIRLANRNGVKMSTMALKTDLCHSTISRLYFGETSRPSNRTILALLLYFGYTVRIQR